MTSSSGLIDNMSVKAGPLDGRLSSFLVLQPQVSCSTSSGLCVFIYTMGILKVLPDKILSEFDGSMRVRTLGPSLPGVCPG